MGSIVTTMTTTAFSMTPMLWVVIDSMAVFRIARLVGKDQVTEKMRARIAHRGWYATGTKRVNRTAAMARGLHDLIQCPWCSSIWAAAVVVILTVTVPNEWRYVAYILTCSAVAGLLSER